MAVKRTRKCCGLVIYSHLKDGAFIAVQKGCGVVNLVCERGIN